MLPADERADPPPPLECMNVTFVPLYKNTGNLSSHGVLQTAVSELSLQTHPYCSGPELCTDTAAMLQKLRPFIQLIAN